MEYPLEKMSNSNPNQQKESLSLLLFSVLSTVAIAGILAHLGIKYSSTAVKAGAAICYFYSLLTCGYLFLSHSQRFSVSSILVTLALVAYPNTSLLLDTLSALSFKKLTDNMIVFGAYYQLPFIALVVATLFDAEATRRVLSQFGKITIVPAFCFSILVSLMGGTTQIGFGHLLLDNCLLPVSLLFVFSQNKVDRTIGLAAMLIALGLSCMIWSRSYMLTTFIVIGCSTINEIRLANTLNLLPKLLITSTVLALAFFVTIQVGNQESSVQSKSIVEKWKLDSLSDAAAESVESLSFMPLWNWEGNSRRMIVSDAFGDFETEDYLFGKGISATYTSFVERHTIEIGILQDAFRWGVVYTGFVVVLSMYSFSQLFKYRQHSVAIALATILLARFVDMFVFGIPRLSFYVLLWNIALIAPFGINREIENA